MRRIMKEQVTHLFIKISELDKLIHKKKLDNQLIDRLIRDSKGMLESLGDMNYEYTVAPQALKQTKHEG